MQMEDFTQDQRENLILYAMKNNHNKFVVPSKHISFGSTPFNWVMIDSGCSTYLQSLQQGQLSSLIESRDLVFAMGVSKGVGVLPGSTLVVKRTNKEPFMVQFPSSNCPLYCPSLRLSLCLEDARILLTAVNENRATLHSLKNDLPKLKSYIADVEKLHSVGFVDAGSRSRTYSLFGQVMLESYHWLQFQGFLFITKSLLMPNEVGVYVQIAMVQSQKCLGSDTGEFDDLKEDDHEGEDTISFEESRYLDDLL